jgi:hypothetical protein
MSFTIEIASISDRDQLVAEIWWNEQMVAELRRGADGAIYLDMYAPPSTKVWSFKLEEWLRAIDEARARLV